MKRNDRAPLAIAQHAAMQAEAAAELRRNPTITRRALASWLSDRFDAEVTPAHVDLLIEEAGRLWKAEIALDIGVHKARQNANLEQVAVDAYRQYSETGNLRALAVVLKAREQQAKLLGLTPTNEEARIAAMEDAIGVIVMALSRQYHEGVRLEDGTVYRLPREVVEAQLQGVEREVKLIEEKG